MKILVIGDSCTDVFIYGRCERLNPEAPIPVFEPTKTVTNQGMAGNVVANLNKLGVQKGRTYYQSRTNYQNSICRVQIESDVTQS